ncbi:MAG TPA: tetratricopeptide repeat protein [Candidatus Hydrogenedentes bacterium]|nr:tetratricopeptide repeat protein [Candidatus Hydrogenedentota bacterium]
MAEPQRESHAELPMEEDEVQAHLKTIDGKFMQTIEADTRLESGVPPGHRPADLDFIQMTGLTRPTNTAEEPSEPSPPPYEEDMNPAHPVDFFESGVRDVDHTLSPPGTEAGASLSTVSPQTDLSALTPRVTDPLPDTTTDRDESTKIPSSSPPKPVQEPPHTPASDIPAPEAGSPPDIENTLAEVLNTLETEESVEQEKPSSESFFDAEAEKTPLPGEGVRNTPALDQQLVEAEQLLRELEHQPREFTAAVSSPDPAPSPPDPPPPSSPPIRQWSPPSNEERMATEEEEEDDRRIVYDYAAAPGRRRKSRRHVSRQRRRFIQMTALVGILIVLCIGIYAAFGAFLKPMMVSPDKLLTMARTQFESGQYLDASRTFNSFAERNPDHPSRPEAEFLAAFALRSAPASSAELAQTQRENALALFDKYLKNNPGDPRHTRAESIRALLLFELGRYDEVIDLLRDPARLTDDTSAALTLLRTLAMAYRRSGDYEHAESTYLQASVLPQNMTSDTDYYELGAMARERAALTDEKAEKTRLATTALEYWTKAIGVSGIDPGAKEEIQKQSDRLKTEFGVTLDTAKTPGPVQEEISAPVAPLTSDSAAAPPAPNPVEEAKQLEAPATTP